MDKRFSNLAIINTEVQTTRRSLSTIMDNILNCISETTSNGIGKFLNNLITLFDEHSTQVTQKQTLGIVNKIICTLIDLEFS